MSGQQQASFFVKPPALKVAVGTPPADVRKYRMETAFRIGRGEDCEIRIEDNFVSRCHVSVTLENGEWLARDNSSSNGMFVNGERVELARIEWRLALRLGVEGPFVYFETEKDGKAASGANWQAAQAEPVAGKTVMIAAYTDKYFGAVKEGETLGAHTMMIRQAYNKVQKKQRWKYTWVLASLSVVILAVVGFAYYQHRELGRQQAVAKELFYAMKAMDVDIANVQRLVQDSGSQQGKDQIRNFQVRRKELEGNYNRFLDTLHLYDSKMSPEDKLILRVTRIFGECELAVPPEYLSEVRSYIGKWKSSPRMKTALKTAREKNYTQRIAAELLAEDLPPQFFYLAMQESDFDAHISGPQTYMGIAKGMWQFVPKTASEYGLKIGPLADLRRPDPGDDRHNWEKATVAAAKYLKFIYSTDAQASGLLVMASYNWGEGNVIKLIRSLPANPKDRNFWQLLAKYRDKIPQETYDYVFYIVSAAAIGENPKLFGFDFDNPLASLEKR
jgi:membrane-bound lytic murein transglycosylase D